MSPPEVVCQLLAVVHVEGCVSQLVAIEALDGLFGLLRVGEVDESVLVDDGHLQDSAQTVEHAPEVFHGDRQADVAHEHGEHGARGVRRRRRHCSCGLLLGLRKKKREAFGS